MTLDEARAYLRSRPRDLKAKEVLELLERMVLIPEGYVMVPKVREIICVDCYLRRQEGDVPAGDF
jgi:hypothetical protein